MPKWYNYSILWLKNAKFWISKRTIFVFRFFLKKRKLVLLLMWFILCTYLYYEFVNSEIDSFRKYLNFMHVECRDSGHKTIVCRFFKNWIKSQFLEHFGFVSLDFITFCHDKCFKCIDFFSGISSILLRSTVYNVRGISIQWQ